MRALATQANIYENNDILQSVIKQRLRFWSMISFFLSPTCHNQLPSHKTTMAAPVVGGFTPSCSGHPFTFPVAINPPSKCSYVDVRPLRSWQHFRRPVHKVRGGLTRDGHKSRANATCGSSMQIGPKIQISVRRKNVPGGT